MILLYYNVVTPRQPKEMFFTPPLPCRVGLVGVLFGSLIFKVLSPINHGARHLGLMLC